jgi:Protein of unknown function (DUF1329)
MPTAAQRRAWVAALALLCAGAPALAGPPPEDQCPTLSGLPGGGIAEDATPVRIHEGMLLTYQDVLLLGSLIPVEVWRNRDAFFHEGMKLEVGPCHRHYPTAGFYREATEKYAGQAKLDAEGNLEGYVAGLPFPPESIDRKAPDAGLRWAWDLERRYRGAGPSGSFRIVDMPSRIGGIQTYTGSWFFVPLSHRADLPKSGYALPEVDGKDWAAGGEFDEPLAARFLSWRQLRPLAVAQDYDLPDDTFVYVPTMRKVRRAASSWVDGVYTPRYRVSGDAGGGGVPIANGSPYGVGGAIAPTAAESIAATENLRRGFEGLALRPNAYRWRVLDEREVLAPINITRTGYPIDRERNFGPSGLSVGSDRWDVRWATVIQGVIKERGRDYDLLTVYVDWQTQEPLYVITKRSHGGQLVEVGILLHRFSGDDARYPTFPNGAPANVFDPVGAVFYDSADGGSGWRRESYDVVSVPRSEEELRRMTSASFLERGH